MRIFLLIAAAAFGQSQADVRKAIDRALPPIQRSAAKFIEERACFSCHHNALSIMTMRMAQERGVRIDGKVLAAVEEKTWKSGGTLDEVVQARNVADPTPNDSLLLMAQEAAGVTDAAAQVRARRLASWQRDDGRWITSDFRPPHSSSLFTTTATAIRALRAHLRLPADDQRIVKARRWLQSNYPVSTEDASFRLMGLVWSGAAPTEVEPARRDLLAMQKADGGWAQLPSYDSDAYSTGEAVFALHESGVQAPKGIAFLIAKQAGNGTWRVKTRMLSPAEVSPPYFETGFPYKKDQFISYAGSCWAVMALLSTMPETVPKPALPTILAAEPSTSSLDPFTQVTAAASYYGNSRAVAALLDAGAPVAPPPGTRARNTPMRLAAMSGDLALVKLLLQRGADPNAGAPVAEAITFGHADVVQALIDAGADVDGVESTGVNLMHWATITNRAELIPILAKAKVPLNDNDDFGYTPLMYAATIDFGDTKTLEALLAAGADTAVRDFQNRTPLKQAERLRHTNIAAVLKRAR